jgi:hypothetical protein
VDKLEREFSPAGLHLIDERAACLAHSLKIVAYDNGLSSPPKDLALAASVFNAYQQFLT